ncbi:MAG: hypothetical protein U1F68_20925 [Gammaproteobacteria bacterium]
MNERATTISVAPRTAELLQSRLDTLVRHCVFEETHLALRTRPTLLTRPQRKAADQARAALIKKRLRLPPTTAEAQNPDLVYADLIPGHRSLAETLERKLRAAGLWIERLDVHQALADIRAGLDASRSDPHWRASLPGDPLPLMQAPRLRGDLSDGFWPPIGQQLFFDDLFITLGAHLPLRLRSLTLDGDGRSSPASASSPTPSNYLGPQGSAKSQTLHQANLAFLLSAGSTRLPYLGGIDFGGSAAGLTTLIQEALRPELRYQVLYRRLQNRLQDAINPLDTQLGCREPLPHERRFAANFLTLLGTPINAHAAEEGVTEIALSVLTEVYAYCRDDAHGHPKRYDPSFDVEVQKALERCPLATAKPSWWQVVDHLFAHGDIVNAVRAQRFAVPNLEDCLFALSNANAIRATWGEKHTASGELLLAALSRQWQIAATQFPFLARPTALDIGNARVVVLDLEDVASRGGAASERETAVAFMLARHVTANLHFLHPDHLPSIPERYRPFHAERIREIVETPKRWFCDEVHRIYLGGQATLIQTEHDNLEARKRNVQYALATQDLAHLSPYLIKHSSVRVICRAEPAALDEIAETLAWIQRLYHHKP